MEGHFKIESHLDMGGVIEILLQVQTSIRKAEHRRPNPARGAPANASARADSCGLKT
jgi:hypothetical protein